MTYHREISATTTNLSTGTLIVHAAESDLVMTWDAETGTLSWSGTLTYILDATVTRVNGTQVD